MTSRYLPALLSLLVPTACQAASNELDFTNDMLARLQSAQPGQQFRIKSDEPLVIQSGQAGQADERTINLHRVYGYCQNNPADECDAQKKEFIEKINILPPDPALKELRVIVRDRQYYQYIQDTIAKSNNSVPARQIGDDLFAIMAFDSPQTIAVANNEMLGKLNLTPESGWRIAMRQTAAVLPPLPDGKKVRTNAMAFQEYEYLASLLADLAKWERIARDAGPDMFVTAVSDNFVFVGTMPSGPKLEDFRKSVVEDCNAQPRCISPNIYRYRNGRWVIAQ